MWRVDVDNMPNQMWTLFDENGETLKTETAPGWYRTSSRAKAERDCARLNRKEETMKAKAEKEKIETAEPLTKVAFRFWYDSPGQLTRMDRKRGEVTAIMPEIPGTDSPYICTCYAHVGQHGSCNISLINQCSRPATEAEYTPLLRELKSIGYRVQVIKRLNQQRYLDTRRAEIARMAAV